jgi:predicted Zn-dependent peptidase
MNAFKKYSFHTFLVLFCLPWILSAQSLSYEVKTAKDDRGESYEYVTNDPMATRIYTLKNGLKVYISQNDVDARVQAMIGVRAGSALEPTESTGLAHYLEHMLFKGGSNIGTVNWTAEQPLLEKISGLYELHRATPDEMAKKNIYAQIDSLSFIAAQYAAPNEFGKLTKAIGAEGVNAATSMDFTFYRENIPSNELERWARLENERMSNLQLRLFHTELEAVYEEYNRSQDNDSRQLFYALLEGLFRKHPYKRPTIGNPFDLKNPSMVNIHKFFDTYYVPNNMCIVLTGDVNAEQAMTTVEQYFGSWKKKKLPKVVLPKEEPITEPREIKLYSKEKEKIFLAYRFDGKSSEDYKFVWIINQLLSNSGKTGLIDTHLNQTGKLQTAGSDLMFFKDYGIHLLSGIPKEGQSLDSVKAMIFGELDNLKEGQFGDWLMEAIVNNIKLFQISALENNISRASSLLYSDLYQVPYQNSVSLVSQLEQITKEEVIAFVKQHYSDNYLVISKLKGEKELLKVEKPSITPLDLKTDNQSAFAGAFMEHNPEGLKPHFVDYKKEFPEFKLKNGMPFYFQKEDKGTFSLRYIIPVGSHHDNLLSFAIQYFRKLGTSVYTPDSLKKELFRYGLSVNLSASLEKSYLNVTGLNENFDKALELVRHMFDQVKSDPQVYLELLAKEEGTRKLTKENKRSITNIGQQYILFGANNDFNDDPSLEELRNQKPEEMLERVLHLFDYEYLIYYSGIESKEEAMQKIEATQKLPKQFAVVPSAKKSQYLPLDKPIVYLCDYDMVQAQVNMVIKDAPYSADLVAYKELYDAYYGQGMSSIVFQQIREARALAYSSGSYYRMDATSSNNNEVVGYIGTQANKLPEAMAALNNLMDTLKFDSMKFELARQSLIKSIESERIPRKYYFGKYQGLLKQGIDYDVREKMYEDLKAMSPENFAQFFNDHIRNPNKQYFILGRKSDLDLEALKRFGTIKEITLEDIFGY